MAMGTGTASKTERGGAEFPLRATFSADKRILYPPGWIRGRVEG